MIINDNFVFIHNPRTGGSFVRNLCKSTFPESHFVALKHYHLPISHLTKDQVKNKLTFGLIRNPWAWYVSLYHFQQPKGQWLCLCSPNEKPTFKQFVKTLLSSEFAKQHRNDKFHPVGNPYAKKTVPVFEYMNNLDIGFFTYRYIYMYSRDYKQIFDGSKDIFTKCDELISMDTVLKTEGLPNNVLHLFNKEGIHISHKDKELWRACPKRNYTNHRPYQSYYDKELINLVRYKDRLIIDKYDYRFNNV